MQEAATKLLLSRHFHFNGYFTHPIRSVQEVIAILLLSRHFIAPTASPHRRHLFLQEAIAEVLEGLIRELKRTNRIDCSDLRLEEGLFRSFDRLVRGNYTVSLRLIECSEMRLEEGLSCSFDRLVCCNQAADRALIS